MSGIQVCRMLVAVSLLSLTNQRLLLAAVLFGVPATPKYLRAEATAAKPLVHLPVDGPLTSGFGRRPDPIVELRGKKRRTRRHKGIDISAQRGTLVRAAGAGTVVTAKRSGGYGRLVVIDHGGGVETRYAHLQRLTVKKGQSVDAGTVVGKVGSSGRATGPHLHFEVRSHGVAVPPRTAIQFKLPPCAKNARHCRHRVRKRLPNS